MHFLVGCGGLRDVREDFGITSVEDALGFGGVDLKVCWEFLVPRGREPVGMQNSKFPT